MKFLIIAVSLLSPLAAVQAQTLKIVKLKQQRVEYAPKSFRVLRYVDDRTDTGRIGSLTGDGRNEKINLQNGAAWSLTAFMANVTQHKPSQAVTVHITKFSFSIKKRGADWQEEGELALTFYTEGKKLVELSSKGQLKTNGEPLDYVDEFIRKSVESDLKRFDTWWEQNKDKIPLAADVKVIASIGRRSDKPNRVVYSPQRPLQISDFMGEQQSNVIELAATMSGIGMESDGKTERGQMVMHVIITPYFDKSMSWFRRQYDAAKDAKVLAHEQTHFEITAIKACELVNELSHTTFTQDNFESKLHEMQQKNADEANKMQVQYDSETNHGTIREKQLEWERKIKARLKELPCP